MPFKSAAARKEYDRQRYLQRKTHGEFVQPSTPRGSNPKTSTQNVKSTSYDPPTLLSSPINKSYAPNRESAFQPGSAPSASSPVPCRELSGNTSPLRENRPKNVTVPQLPAGCSSQNVAPPAPVPEKKTNFQVILDILGPLAGIPAPAPARPAPAVRPALQPAAPRPAAPQPRVRSAQQVRQASGFAPEEAFHIQGGD